MRERRVPWSPLSLSAQPRSNPTGGSGATPRRRRLDRALVPRSSSLLNARACALHCNFPPKSTRWLRLRAQRRRRVTRRRSYPDSFGSELLLSYNLCSYRMKCRPNPILGCNASRLSAISRTLDHLKYLRPLDDFQGLKFNSLSILLQLLLSL